MSDDRSDILCVNEAWSVLEAALAPDIADLSRDAAHLKFAIASGCRFDVVWPTVKTGELLMPRSAVTIYAVRGIAYQRTMQ